MTGDHRGRRGAAGPPLLTRRDPAVLLAAVVVVPVLLLRVDDPAPVLLLWIVAVLGLPRLTGLRLGALLRGQVPFLGFAVSLVMVNAVTRDGVPLLAVGPLEVTVEGLRTGSALGLRALVVGTCALAFLAAVDPARLLVSLHRVARLPVRAAVALTVAHRVVDDLPEEWATIRRAQALRAPPTVPHRTRIGRAGAAAWSAPVRLQRSPAAVAQAAFVLLTVSIRRAERMAVAVEGRALGALPAHQRTAWHVAEVGWPDAVVVVAVVVACGVTAVVA